MSGDPLKLLEMLDKQLSDRIAMIPKYVDDPMHWVGSKNFTKEMIPALQKQLEECWVAILAIELIRSAGKKERKGAKK